MQRISGLHKFEVRFGSWTVGRFYGRDTEVCEQLRKKEVEMCCLQEVRWRRQGARFVGCRGRRYKLWWSGNNDGIRGVGILVQEELCEKVVEVRRKSDRVMAIVLAFEEKVICAFAPQVGRSDCEKDKFYNDMASEWGLQNPSEVVLGMGDFNGQVGRQIDGFEGVYGGYSIGKRNVEGRGQLEFCDEKELCVANTWFEKEQRKITYSMGGNETEIDFVLVGKNNRKYLKDVKAILWELQHRLVVTDIDKRKLKKVVKNEQTIRRRVWKLKENNLKTKFQERVRNWLMLMLPIYGILLKIVCCKLVMKYVERGKVEKIMGIHGGGMNR